MKNKFLTTVGIIAIFVIALVIFSCTRETQEDQDTITTSNDVLALLEKKKNIVKVENATTLKVLNVLVDQNSENLFFQTKNKNEYFIISKIGNKFTLLKGVLSNNEFIGEKKFELLDNMDDEGNGNFVIKNIDEDVAIIQTYRNDKFSNKINTIGDIRKTNKINDLCQRENHESFSSCNSRETDQFCDDFVSTVAYITNPSIAILIAGLCSC
ncbi:hypothetical protein [Flavobacterium sp. CF136]|uniref:hypothetical protein n=1 Tax=Flavobacterium sp. (strain CF136) TaxID=1144313 RepID=UPI000271855A|nr:hypothetical protein [Flavobacterium sp. CF136]EJL63947.1 hypothetical protein PMI10_02179 [Flavobacterium sp. CF136]